MPIHHLVEQGDSVIKLSLKHGLFAETIWSDSANAALREEREDMNILLPGDYVVIPDLRTKSEQRATGQTHRFRRKGIPAVLRLQLFDGNEPRTNQSFSLAIDGATRNGKTDGDGVLEVFLPPTAKKGKLTIGPDHFEIEMAFGHLDPITELSGVQKRLSNLGFHCEPDGELNESTKKALGEFQRSFDLELTLEADAATLAKLEEVHNQTGAFNA